MMKRTLLAFGFCLLAAPAWATCGVSNLQVKDNLGTTAAVPYADDGAGASNCSPQVQIKQGGNVVAVTAGSALKVDGSAVTQPASVTTWGGGTLGAMANYGTSPGAVLVPGVNAFVTNANSNGQAAPASSSPVVVARNSGTGSTIAGAVPGTAGSASTDVLTIQGIASMTPLLSNPGTAANWGVVATGAAPPANAIYLGANASGATGGQVRGLINCDSHVFKHITTATDTLAVQGVASQTIYICGWRSRAAGVATWFLENTASTNANCSSSNTQITGVATEAANTGEVNNNPIWGGLKNTSANGLCINSTGTGGVDVDIWYTQF